ncbi:hypothetical protein F5Y15DRAFT_335666 [Xylariaceae sp. FL0016]|nr:hypothetical protein F5Y15DRAFT_335666 [Xylariaceae sp. FL0016]
MKFAMRKIRTCFQNGKMVSALQGFVFCFLVLPTIAKLPRQQARQGSVVNAQDATSLVIWIVCYHRAGLVLKVYPYIPKYP